jgi:hypothetical protein
MTKTQKSLSPFARAALALDAELADFESLAAAAHRQPLTSKKAIERAAHTANEAAQCQQRILDLTRAFIEALNTTRARNEQTAANFAQRREALQARTLELNELLERFVRLGDEAKEISTFVAATTEDSRGSTLPMLAQVDERLDRVIAEGQALLVTANASGFTDLGREIESVRQQMQAVRHKVNQLQQRIASTIN